MNLLHDVDPGTKSEMNVIIEIPRGSQNKYEIDKKTGMIALDRVLHTAQTYPFDYGFVPQTLWDDGDALDVVLLTTVPLFPGLLVRARPVAILPMVDGGEADEKVIAVPADDPRLQTSRTSRTSTNISSKRLRTFLLPTRSYKTKKSVSVSSKEGLQLKPRLNERGSCITIKNNMEKI